MLVAILLLTLAQCEGTGIGLPEPETNPYSSTSATDGFPLLDCGFTYMATINGECAEACMEAFTATMATAINQAEEAWNASDAQWTETDCEIESTLDDCVAQSNSPLCYKEWSKSIDDNDQVLCNSRDSINTAYQDALSDAQDAAFECGMSCCERTLYIEWMWKLCLEFF